MAALRLSSLPNHQRLLPSFSSSSPFRPSVSSLPFQRSHLNHLATRLHVSSPHSATFTTATPNAATAQDPTPSSETFDWFSHWYPLAPVCDLDKRAPKALTVLGLDVVIWWDRVEGAWKVFDDRCPHRLAPLSEGRIDNRGRLQCVYHGWCFDGAGACKYIPQAPALGPPVHKNERACVAVYPSIEQNKLLWFWPNADPQYKDIMNKTKPPFFPEVDDPSFAVTMISREALYGYDILTENLVDPAHLAYSHYGILALRTREDPGRVETDIEGGTPIELTIEKSDISGFVAKEDPGYHKFIAPCVYYFSVIRNYSENSQASKNEPRSTVFLLLIPVSPGKSRVISIATRNYATWIDKFVPRWYYHIGANLLIDSDLCLLHAQERRLAMEGISNWHKACYVPTQSDTMIVAFRSWFRKYSNNQVNYGTKNFAPLPTPPREQLMDRYWSHVVHCKSCSGALRALKAIEVCLQVVSIAIIGILAIAKPSLTSNITKATVVSVAVMCFLASRWLSQFIHKTFYFHDYNHALHRASRTLMGSLFGGL